MALKSTVFKAQLAIADIDHGHYATEALTLARHPSETDERMMMRLLALALNAHQVQTLCQGNARIGFGAGLSSPDEPDVLLADFTGAARLWIEVGQPDEKPLLRACQRAEQVIVYAFGSAAEVWWKGIERKLARLERLQVWRVPSAAATALAALAERNMELQLSVIDGAATVVGTRATVTVEPLRWK